MKVTFRALGQRSKRQLRISSGNLTLIKLFDIKFYCCSCIELRRQTSNV